MTHRRQPQADGRQCHRQRRVDRRQHHHTNAANRHRNHRRWRRDTQPGYRRWRAYRHDFDGAHACRGDISITATNGSIQLNGTTQETAIRTAGDVTLTAGSFGPTGLPGSGFITEAAQGFIQANKLSLRASSNVDLAGANQVSTLSAPAIPTPPGLPFAGINGALTFNNIGALTVGETTTGAGVRVTTNGPAANLNVTDTLSSGGGAMTLTVAGALNVDGGGLRDAVVRSSGARTSRRIRSTSSPRTIAAPPSTISLPATRRSPRPQAG